MPDEKLSLSLPPDQGGETTAGLGGCQPSLHAAWLTDTVETHRRRDALECPCSPLLHDEHPCDQALSPGRDDHRIGHCRGLDTCRDVGRVAKRLCLGPFFASEDHGTRVQPNTNSQRHSAPGLHVLHRGNDREPCAHPALGIVLVRVGIAEEGDEAVAEILGHVPLKAADGLSRRVAIASGEVAPLFGVELGSDLGRPDEIAEENCELAALPLPGGQRG